MPKWGETHHLGLSLGTTLCIKSFIPKLKQNIQSVRNKHEDFLKNYSPRAQTMCFTSFGPFFVITGFYVVCCEGLWWLLKVVVTHSLPVNNVC